MSRVRYTEAQRRPRQRSTGPGRASRRGTALRMKNRGLGAPGYVLLAAILAMIIVAHANMAAGAATGFGVAMIR